MLAEERADALRGRGCLQRAEHQLADVGETVADLESHVDSRCRRRFGEALGIAQQQIGRPDLDQERWQTGQPSDQGRGQQISWVGSLEVVGPELPQQGRCRNRILRHALRHRGSGARQIHGRVSTIARRPGRRIGDDPHTRSAVRRVWGETPIPIRSTTDAGG